mmetsp:Transcript_106521/g.299310  ORF Transcript_106521/g.299310 Transcript_106521/m.299310 type:complete len:196 (+) Transcript_106521:134-721(+)
MGEACGDQEMGAAASRDHDEDARLALASLQQLLRLNFSNIEPLSRGPAELLPHVCLGSADQARDLRVMRSLGITHVLNCAAWSVHTGASFYEPLGIEYDEFQAEDTQGYNIFQHYSRMATIADAAAKAKGRLLVHCEAGVNRSGTLCLAYYAMHTGTPLVASAEYCKAQRGRICTNPAFQLQLVEFAQNHQLQLR